MARALPAARSRVSTLGLAVVGCGEAKKERKKERQMTRNKLRHAKFEAFVVTHYTNIMHTV